MQDKDLSNYRKIITAKWTANLQKILAFPRHVEVWDLANDLP